MAERARPTIVDKTHHIKLKNMQQYIIKTGGDSPGD